MKRAKLISVHISEGGIPKLPVESSFVSVQGLEGDGHDHEKHYRLIQAVSIQDIEKLEELNAEGYELVPGSTGENFTVENLDVNNLPLGTRLSFPSGLELELTKVRKPCYVLDKISSRLKTDILGRCGMYAQVNVSGSVQPGDEITVTPR